MGLRGKLNVIRRYVNNDSIKKPHGNTGRCYMTQANTYAKVTSFWAAFFEDLSQDVSDTQRLWPIGMNKHQIYDQYFKPYMRRQFGDDVRIPAFSSFTRASRDFKFSDVARRPAHSHARCTDCSKFKTIIANGK